MTSIFSPRSYEDVQRKLLDDHDFEYSNSDTDSFSSLPLYSTTRHSRSPCNRTRLYLLLLTTALVSNTTYLLSLRGASTPKAMNHYLGTFAILLNVSILTSSIQLWAVSLSALLSVRVKWILHSLQLLNFAAWAWWDMGNRLEQHGAYNLLIFFLILLLSNAVVACLRLWYLVAVGWAEPRKPRRIWYQLLCSSVFLGIAVFIAARNKENRLRIGFFGNEIPTLQSSSDEKTCSWQEAVPWFDLIPFRLNVFTVGSLVFAVLLISSEAEVADVVMFCF